MIRPIALAVVCVVFPACNCGSSRTNPGDDGGATDGGDSSDSGATAADGGTATDGGTVACVTGLQSISIAPSDSTVALVSGQTVAFTATGTMADGGTVDVSNQVSWSVDRSDDTPPGTVDSSGVFTPGAGGQARVVAADSCVSGSTHVTVKLTVAFNDPGSATTARFGGTVVTGNAAKSPAIVYPNDQTRFPRNIYKVLFQWRKQGNEFFRLTFDGPGSKTVVWSDGQHVSCATATPPAGCYEADLSSWTAIAGSNAGEVVTLTVDGVTASDTNVYRSASIDIGFSKKDVRGAIFYWSTTAAGIRRASVSDAAPESYAVAKPVATVLPNSGAVKCIACHTVSRSGKKMIAATEALTKGTFVYDVTLQPPPSDYITKTIAAGGHEFGTISPDDTRAVATSKGLLQEYDITDAGPVSPKVADLPLGTVKATHPDWSPTGGELAFATAAGDAPAGAGISVIAYAGGDAWGAIRSLAPPNGKTNLFPSYSPEGDWVAYSRGTKGGHGDLTTQLYVIKADGTAGPDGIELVKANRWVNNQITAGQFENNQPTWAPPGDLEWVAFNSLRPYGVVLPNGGTQQIWVAAIDRAKLDGGTDPSYPAFRFAFQGLMENNHRAYWTLDVRQPEDGGACRATGAECVPGASSGCCPGSDCLQATEFTYACLPPGTVYDAGTCLATGAACSQTSGPSCCQPAVCDSYVDGGLFCQPVIN